MAITDFAENSYLGISRQLVKGGLWEGIAEKPLGMLIALHRFFSAVFRWSSCKC